LRLAELASKWDPENPAAQRVLGWAKLVDAKPAEAQEILEPLSAKDSGAALGLAKARLAQGQREAAIRALRQAELLRASGLTRQLTRDLLDELALEPLPAPDGADVLARLDKFDPGVFSFLDKPSEAVRLEVTPVRRGLAYGEPMRFRFTLTNRGSYPVTLGTDAMIRSPQVLVSVAGTWRDAPRWDRFLSISLLRQSILLPGESVGAEQNLAIGPFAAGLEVQPQRDLTLRFSFLFDPMISESGRWMSASGPLQPPPIEVRREPLDATPEGVRRLTHAARNGNEAQRIRAARAMAALIAERRRALADTIAYTAFSIDDIAMEKSLLSMLGDASPLVRAHTLDALQILQLDPTIIEAAAPMLADNNWLVRLLAVDLFANAQGPVFEPVVRTLSAADADPLVRELASLYLSAWSGSPAAPATSRPAADK
jgi:hypothetical protein